MMQVTYRLTDNDLLEWMRTANPSYPRLKIVGGLWLLACVGNSAFGGDHRTRVVEWIWPLLPGVIGILLLFLDRWSAYLFRKKHPECLDEIQMTITANGLESLSVHSQSRTSWADYIRWMESRNLFLIFQSEIAAVALPKRAFDLTQIASLRSLLQDKVGQGKTQGTKNSLIKIVVFWALILLAGVLLWMVKKGH